MAQFEFKETKIKGVWEIQPNVHGDDRGYFFEVYQKDLFEPYGIKAEFLQDNESFSTKGVLRGLHFQKNHTQGKLVRVTQGRVFDVAVDCRPGSETFGQWTAVTLDADKHNMFYLPEGMAHGFLVLSDTAQFTYKCTDIYDPTSEGGIPWDDPTVHVEWPELDMEYKTSPKDKEHESFADQKFEYFKQYTPEK
jgi:dTDP-4-dehydrorhamnose 3,5-epimerase